MDRRSALSAICAFLAAPFAGLKISSPSTSPVPAATVTCGIKNNWDEFETIRPFWYCIQKNNAEVHGCFGCTETQDPLLRVIEIAKESSFGIGTISFGRMNAPLYLPMEHGDHL